MNYEISDLQIKNTGEKANKSNKVKALDLDIPQSTDKHEKGFEKEFIDTKIINKEYSSSKKENDNDNLNTLNAKEKNIITVDLTNDEKIVFSQLGINPLLKLGKEYITSNNFVRLKNNSKGQESIKENKNSW